ncbi:hypothetical protein D2T29_12240 [Sinirhodobacter populi]|uniref:Ner winged helix-turn-helix DNA-binding domain-containing protein n=1 Tax=Paenirhodobacter populi TaxID=2306993 RepID=A0A443KCH1_9RHOB|nr:helix-turn-helix domain-containing protein [Sinirhodobacter populi]RWR30435.1 hypothetical protein D2T29_12240 [Sinirhodobacter populi]
MSSNDHTRSAQAMIKDALKSRGLTYQQLAERIGEPADKLPVAVRCSSGVGARSIEIRRKVAIALGLKPEDVWNKAYLTPRIGGARSGKEVIPPASTFSSAEWKALQPRERVRAKLADLGSDLKAMAAEIGMSYSTMTNAIYQENRAKNSERRAIIAEFLKCEPNDIWPDDSGQSPQDYASLDDVIKERPELMPLFGFGDMTRREE